MRISDWSSDVCSSDLKRHKGVEHHEANGSEDNPVAPGEDDVLELLDRDLPFHLADEEESQGGTTHDHQSDREREKSVQAAQRRRSVSRTAGCHVKGLQWPSSSALGDRDSGGSLHVV